jgi:hypothetical protein
MHGRLLLFLFSTILFCPGIIAQSGINCANAIVVDEIYTALPAETATTSKWYTFNADPGTFSISLTNSDQGDSALVEAILYSGSCSGLTVVDTLNAVPFPNLAINFVNPSSGVDYFIELKSSNSIAKNYSILFQSIAPIPPTPCSCPPALVAGNTTCDMICNGSFEYTNGSINTNGLLDYACPWRLPSGGPGSTDLFSAGATNANFLTPNNICGSEVPVTGSNYAGFAPYSHPAWSQFWWSHPDFKEYLVIPLNQTLVAGQCYQLTFHLSRAESSRFASGNFGILFTNIAPSQSNFGVIPLTPQIVFSAVQFSTTWTQYSITYTAVGNESYMTIGNFDANATTPSTQTGYINYGNVQSYFSESYYYIDDVSLTPCCNTMSVGSFPVDICPGEPITLAAVSPCNNITYSWTPSNLITGSPTSPTTTAVAYSPQVFTCEVTLASYGCTISASTNVNILPGALVDAGPDVTICEGQNVTLTGTGAIAFNGWQDILGNILCNGCSTVAVSPLITTDYVYFAYNNHNGCYGYDTMTVFVNPSPHPTIISPPGAVTCDNSLMFTAGGGLFASYLWTSNASSVYSSSTIPFYHADWANSFTPPDGYVTLTVTNSNGCTGSATVIIPHCCCGAHVAVVNDNVDSILVSSPGVLQMQGGNWVMVNTDLCINGIFTVNQNLILRNVDVFMGTEAKIIVAPGVLFRLESTGQPQSQYQTTIQACDRMWDGIYVDGTNTSTLLDIRDGTIIEDAHTAIVSSNGGNFQVNGSILAGPVKLNKNDTAIWIKPFLTLHPGSVTNTIISSDAPVQAGGTPGITSSGNSCIAPVLAPAKAGIVIQNAVVNIGNTNSIARRNTFQRVQFGIVATSSTVTVKNNQFLNIARLINVPFSGYAIYSRASKTAPGFLTVGGPQPLDTNRFYNCNVGISCNDGVSLYCERNGFINQPNQALIGTYAIGMFFCNSQICEIKSNHMSRWRTGIWLLDNNGLTGEIRSNWINVKPNTTLPIPNSSGQYGIRVNNAVQLPMDLYVVQNDISRNRVGIEFINVVTAAGQQQPRIRYNNIGFDFNANFFTNNICFGIRVINSPETQVDIDTVCYNYKQYFTGPLPTNALATQLRGIHIENSNNVNVTNNYCNRLGSGIWMEALCPASRIACNQLVRNWNGVFLNTALIGSQYNLLPNDNRYALTPPSAHSVNADIEGFVQSTTNWHYRNSLGNWFVPNNFPPNPFVPVINNGITTCGTPPPPLAIQRQMDWSGIVADTISYSIPVAENRHNSRELAYRHFNRNPLLLNLSSPDDSLFVSFATDLSSTPTGQFSVSIDSLIAGNVTSAADINNMLTCTYYPDQVRQQVHDIYLETWALGNSSFTSEDTLFLISIALEDPQDLTDVVYTARVMLNLDTNFNALRVLTAPESTQDSSSMTVYPNPTDQSVTILYPVEEDDNASLRVMNSLGQVVLQQRLYPGNLHEMSTIELSEGVYFIEVVAENQKSKSCKLIVKH